MQLTVDFPLPDSKLLVDAAEAVVFFEALLLGAPSRNSSLKFPTDLVL